MPQREPTADERSMADYLRDEAAQDGQPKRTDAHWLKQARLAADALDQVTATA